MNDICKAILHIAFAILCALLAGAQNPVDFFTALLLLASVCNAWRAIELFMGEDIF